MASDPELQSSHNTEWWEKVDQLLQSALERPPEERSAFLQESCAGDPSLLWEVQSLLSAHLRAKDFLENPPLAAELPQLHKPGDLEGVEIGPYRLQALLGSGGMGEVYKAMDSRLNRAIAIKVLSAAASEDTRLHYFEREARLASSLNHPNIVTIYDVGRSEFGPYIAMEWVDGKTLRNVLADGLLPLNSVLHLASQLADGLAKAHTAGIFHRDLKPENVMVTADGLLKILDFGLAKLAPSMTVESDQGGLRPGTKPGVILGTVGYMSPEQALGLPADFRSDQFSLGTILYEMVTGKRAFERATSIETLSAIIRDEPEPIASLNPRTPEPCRRVIERCLSKRPEERYASTSDLAANLKNLNDNFRQISALELAHPTRDTSKTAILRALVWALLFGMILVAGLTVFWPRATPVPVAITFGHGHVSDARFPADSNSVIYGASLGQGQQLYHITQLPNPEARRMGTKSDAGIWAVSRKGEMAISYPCLLHWGLCTGTVAVAPAGAGEPREIVSNVTSADWSTDGARLISAQQVSRTRARIIEAPLSGSPITVLDDIPGWISDIRVLPGNQIAFILHPLGDLRGSVYLVGPDRKRKLLSMGWKTVSGLAWHPGTQEVWFSASRERRSSGFEIRAVTLDGKKERSVYLAPSRVWLKDISPDGRRVLVTVDSPRAVMRGLAPGDSVERDLSWFDYSTVADLSSDGTKLLFYEWGERVLGVHTAFLRDTDGSEPKRLGEGKPMALSPDHRWVLALQDTQPQQLVVLPTEVGEPKVLARGDIVGFSGWAAWTPDSNRVVFSTIEPDGGRTYVQDIDQGFPQPVTPDGMVGVLLSPDGKRVVAEDKYGEYFIYTLESGEHNALTGYEEGDILLQWSDSHTIFLRDSFLRHPGDDRFNIYKLNLLNDERELWKPLALPPTAGLIGIGAGPGEVRITPDGRSYAYVYWTAPSVLYLIEGLR